MKNNSSNDDNNDDNDFICNACYLKNLSLCFKNKSDIKFFPSTQTENLFIQCKNSFKIFENIIFINSSINISVLPNISLSTYLSIVKFLKFPSTDYGICKRKRKII